MLLAEYDVLKCRCIITLVRLYSYWQPNSPLVLTIHDAPCSLRTRVEACTTKRTSDGRAGAYIDGDQADFRRPEDSSLETGPEVHLVANWHPAGLALFDTEAWGDPEVHASAAMEVLSGTQVLCIWDVPAQRTFLQLLSKV